MNRESQSVGGGAGGAKRNVAGSGSCDRVNGIKSSLAVVVVA